MPRSGCSASHGVNPNEKKGPTLANAFLCHFEKQWHSDCTQDFCPNIYEV